MQLRFHKEKIHSFHSSLFNNNVIQKNNSTLSHQGSHEYLAILVRKSVFQTIFVCSHLLIEILGADESWYLSIRSL